MIEVHPGLFVGDETDERATRGRADWFVVHACKEPFHRDALNYTGRAAPTAHPEYLVAHRPGCIILNLVDADEPRLIRHECIAAAVDAIAANIVRSKVLIHCNKGQSRAPTIALLYLALQTDLFDDCDYLGAVERFRALYPPYAPAAGMAGYSRGVWLDGAPIAEPDPPPEIVTPRLTPRFSSPVVFRF